jgi:hypothetical protein
MGLSPFHWYFTIKRLLSASGKAKLKVRYREDKKENKRKRKI